jgi:hypothetical protein
MSLVERARIRRNLNEAQLARALRTTLEPPTDRARLRLPAAVPVNGAARIAELRQAVRRERAQAPEPLPPDEPMAELEPDAMEQAGPADGHDRVPSDATDAPTARPDDRQPAGTRGRAG